MLQQDGRRLNGHRLLQLQGTDASAHCSICNQKFRWVAQADATPCRESVTHLLGLPHRDPPLWEKSTNRLDPAIYLTYCGLRVRNLPRDHATAPAQPAIDGSTVPNLYNECREEAMNPQRASKWTGTR